MDSSSVDPGAEEAVDEADDWVAVRCGAFSPRDPQGGRARFLVGWNEGGRQFAITAHICWPSEKASAACRTPGRDQSSRKDRSSNLMKTIGAAGEDGDDDDDDVGLGVLVDDAWEDEGKSLKMKDWEEEFDEDVKAEGDGASRILSFAGLLTPAEMLSTHSEVSLLCPSLAAYLPPTPLGEVEGASSGGFWSLLFPLPPPEPVSDAQRAELCGAMERYLSGISDSCGWRAVVWLLFRSTVAGQDDDDDGAITEEECYESLGEVHRKALHDELRRMKKEILALLAQHNSATSLVDLLALYDKEDVSVENVLSAAASLHHFLLQPFRELRALASLRRQQFRRQLDRGGLGPLRVNELRRQRDVWTECERNATSRIEDITLKHYTFTSQILRVMLRAMQADSGRFGASAWDSATPRMLRLAVSVAMETLQCNQATELVLVQKRRELKRQMLSLSRSALEEPCVVDDTERTGFQIQSAQPLVQLNRLESKCYDLELRVCDTRLHSLRLREQLISSHRHALQREMQEIDDSVCYHDTFESLEAMQEVGEMGLVASGDKERLCSQDLDLQARLADILSERARLRIKKERCISRRREKLHEQQEHERRWNLHHAVQLRREQQRESEGQRRDWLQQERQRTVQRLHEYRQKHPNEVISHPQRLKNLTRLKHEDHVTSTLVKVGRSLGRTTRTGRLRCNRQSQEIPVQIFCKHGVGTETDKTISACPSSLQLPQSFEQQSQQPPKAPPLPPTALTPPSAPPPPPPLPTTGFSEKESSKARDSTHRLDEKGKAFPSHHSPPASFDPNELVRARERLRKAETGPGVFTPERNDSPMDEVLASLKLGAFSLRKVGATQRDRKTEHLEPKPETLMDQIRKGVQLRQTPPATTRHGYHGDDPLTQSIRLAMQRIKEASPDSEDDGEVEGEAEESSGDWDI